MFSKPQYNPSRPTPIQMVPFRQQTRKTKDCDGALAFKRFCAVISSAILVSCDLVPVITSLKDSVCAASSSR